MTAFGIAQWEEQHHHIGSLRSPFNNNRSQVFPEIFPTAVFTAAVATAISIQNVNPKVNYSELCSPDCTVYIGCSGKNAWWALTGRGAAQTIELSKLGGGRLLRTIQYVHGCTVGVE